MSLIVDIRADSKFPIDRERLRAALRTAWEAYGISEETHVSVAVVGSRKMAELNQRYLNKKGPTDVLSFAQQGTEREGFGFVVPPGSPLELGDIVLCYPLIIDQAVTLNVLVDERIIERALHGMKHLMGDEEH